jgi:hypothetical protein
MAFKIQSEQEFIRRYPSAKHDVSEGAVGGVNSG